ncbi:MAG: cyclase family protein, partial [Hyphomicrobiaceae bacterium]
MCGQSVIMSVKERMLSRRDVMLSTAGAATAGAAAAAAPFPAWGAMPKAVSDLTHELHAEFPTFDGGQQFFMDQKFNWKDHTFNLFELRLNEHIGTHIDAPLHFSEDRHSVAEIPVSSLIAPLAVVDIRAKAADDADAQVTPDDIKAWIGRHGPVPDRACVAMNSGWSARVATAKFRNADSSKVMHFPGFHVETSQMLRETTTALGLAVDTLSLDYGPSQDFATHNDWLPTNRWGLENIAHLDTVPAVGATLVVGAPKHRGGSGGPSRVLALM